METLLCMYFTAYIYIIYTIQTQAKHTIKMLVSHISVSYRNPTVKYQSILTAQTNDTDIHITHLQYIHIPSAHDLRSLLP